MKQLCEIPDAKSSRSRDVGSTGSLHPASPAPARWSKWKTLLTAAGACLGLAGGACAPVAVDTHEHANTIQPEHAASRSSVHPHRPPAHTVAETSSPPRFPQPVPTTEAIPVMSGTPQPTPRPASLLSSPRARVVERNRIMSFEEINHEINRLGWLARHGRMVSFDASGRQSFDYYSAEDQLGHALAGLQDLLVFGRTTAQQRRRIIDAILNGIWREDPEHHVLGRGYTYGFFLAMRNIDKENYWDEFAMHIRGEVGPAIMHRISRSSARSSLISVYYLLECDSPEVDVACFYDNWNSAMIHFVEMAVYEYETLRGPSYRGAISPIFSQPQFCPFGVLTPVFMMGCGDDLYYETPSAYAWFFEVNLSRYMGQQAVFDLTNMVVGDLCIMAWDNGDFMSEITRAAQTILQRSLHHRLQNVRQSAALCLADIGIPDPAVISGLGEVLTAGQELTVEQDPIHRLTESTAGPRLSAAIHLVNFGVLNDDVMDALDYYSTQPYLVAGECFPRDVYRRLQPDPGNTHLVGRVEDFLRRVYNREDLLKTETEAVNILYALGNLAVEQILYGSGDFDSQRIVYTIAETLRTASQGNQHFINEQPEYVPFVAWCNLQRLDEAERFAADSLRHK